MAVAESLSGLQRAAVEGKISSMRDQLEAMITAKLDDVPRDQRKNKERQLRKEMEMQLNSATEAALAGATPFSADQVKPIADLLSSFFTADAITVRVMPCGRSRPEYSFVGSLLGRDEYIQRERDALFSRYGSIISGWTSVLQVASVSSEADAIAARNVELSGINLAPGGVIDELAPSAQPWTCCQ